MDISSTRLKNLRHLVDQHTKAGRTKKEAAVALDMSASFLSQLLGGKKMGDDVARKIEAAAHLTHGWMDTPANAMFLTEEEHAAFASRPARLDGTTLAAATRLVRKACENLELEFDSEDAADADLVLVACDYLQERREKDVTVDNLVDFTKRLREINKGVSLHEGETGAGRAGSGAGGKGQARKAS